MATTHLNSHPMIMQSEGIVLEFFLNSKNVPGDNLKQKVENYCQMYQVSPQVRQLMHIIRSNRNIAAHALNKTPEMIDYTSPNIRDYQKAYYEQKKQKAPKHLTEINLSNANSVIKRGKKVVAACKFGFSCTRSDCTFVHIEGRAIDEDNTNSTPPTAPHAPSASASPPLCKFGKSCLRKDCTFYHERDQVVKQTEPKQSPPPLCKFGNSRTLR
eukprot:TRINITY_DN10463_c0_g1_i2.p1 TRINITY_DN10463_c0_g1~~TRINITY_DN10463_c0_g1_i2.p1  ORF type:complete len:214 (+),score=44.62 TRINITY_DN10463_c0_g1_i2:93-734(+)